MVERLWRRYREFAVYCLIGGSGVALDCLVFAGLVLANGVGVIDNDFHRRKDLTPNVCALYVEAAWRGRGIAGQLLERVCRDMRRHGCGVLYLVTDHTSFYERYGWHFLCMVQEEDNDNLIRSEFWRQHKSIIIGMGHNERSHQSGGNAP